MNESMRLDQTSIKIYDIYSTMRLKTLEKTNELGIPYHNPAYWSSIAINDVAHSFPHLSRWGNQHGITEKQQEMLRREALEYLKKVNAIMNNA